MNQRSMTYVPNLVAWRTKFLLTMGEVSRRSGVAASTLVRIERGGLARRLTVVKLARAIGGITPTQLLNEDPDKPVGGEQQ